MADSEVPIVQLCWAPRTIPTAVCGALGTWASGVAPSRFRVGMALGRPQTAPGHLTRCSGELLKDPLHLLGRERSERLAPSIAGHPDL